MNHQKRKIRRVTLAVLIYSFLSLIALRSGQTQDCHGGPPPEKRGAGPHGPPPGDQDDLHRPPPGPADGTQSTMRGGLQLGPPGRWWDDPPFAQELGLSAAQANRMDQIFQANRSTLLDLYRSLQREQATLERLTTGIRLHEQEIFRQIDRVTRASAALEKANAHMLLQIREQMTDEQIERLDQHRPKPPS
ncbi:MAG TPA: hypothetical protein VFE27_13760 [Acidobacteriaceae bacterium]|nr:hypothetical protein [Acidobacteriaceae bacterium]